jgi:hypothetical protein
MKKTENEALSTSEGSKTDATFEASQIPQKYERQISKLLSKVVDLTFISEKGHGKTVACENLASKIIQRPDTRLIVFESFPKWSDEFPIPYLEIPQSWIVETSKTVNLDKTWIQHENAFSVLHGDIINQFLKENRNVTFSINHEDIEAIAFFEYSVIYRFYRQKYDLLRKGFPMKEQIYFVLEEAQNSLDGHILSSKLFGRYRKLFSEMRNMGLHAILITQRLQDLSTYFRCRTSLGIGKVQLDDFDLKLKRMLRPIGKDKAVLVLPKRSFYFSAIDDIINFPEWTPQKAQEWTPRLEPQTKKKSFLGKLFDFIFCNTEPQTERQRQTVQEDEDQEFEEEQDEDSDLILGGAW